MEGKNKSSFASDLLGSKGSDSSSASSSSGIFGSIFTPPSSKVLGRESVQPDGGKVADKPNQDSAALYWNSRMRLSDDTDPYREAGTRGVPNTNAYYQEEKTHPCHYSSSIYYGGQDVYSRPKSTTQNSAAYTNVNKDNNEDDSEGASRGNWWQGSLYY